MKKAILLLCVFLLTLSASAQTGFPPYGSFENGGFDAINRQNLNVNFAIPIVSSPGRGQDFNFSIVYDSLIWTNTGTAWSPITDENGNPTWGWKKDTPAGTVTFLKLTRPCITGPPQDPFIEETFRYSMYAFTDVAGTRHSFNVTFHEDPTSCNYNTGPRTGEARDGSGIFIDASYPEDPEVTIPDGKELKGDRLTDTNGNFFSAIIANPNETHWKDTVGRKTLKIKKQGNGTIKYSILDPTGSYEIATMHLQSFDIQTNFACSGVAEYTGSAYLPTSIDLPNQQSYSFEYETTPGGDTTGRLSKVILPTGGSYEYLYTGPNGGIDCANGAAKNLTRKIDDGVTIPIPTWILSRTPSGSNWITTVDAPALPYDSAGNRSVFTFDSNGRLTTTEIYQGTSSLKRTINTTWAGNGTPASATVILEDNKQSKTETAFDDYGNLTLLKEYDWGSGAPGSIVRTTQMTYESDSEYTDRNIRNRLTQQIIRAGGTGGTVESLTDIEYDNTAFEECPSGVAQHDESGHGCSFTTRGNPTRVRTYTNPAGPSGVVDRYFYYDSLGNLRKADLDCCQQKVWDYSSTTEFAYPDSVTSGPAAGPQLTQAFFYNFDTGLVTSTTDENEQTTTFAYDDLKRLTTVTRPDGAQITTAYDDDNLTVTVATPVQGTDKVKQQTSYDQLGRPFKQCLLDGSGATISCTETQYDVLSRGYRVSNPFTGSAADWTEARFDALGRQTTVIAPDGDSAVFTYAGNAVTVTDPVGKQRSSSSDALGRLIQVGEPGGEGQPATPGTGSATVSGSEQSTVVEQPATPGTGSATVSGSEQSKQVETAPATPGTGSVTVSGSEQSTQVETQPATPGSGSVTIIGSHQCFWDEVLFRDICDSGSVSITVNGFTKTATYSRDGATAADIAADLRFAFNDDPNSPVTAGGTGTTVTLTAKTTGADTNYPLSTSWTWRSILFLDPSFTASPSGSTLTGGQDAQYTTVYDSGTVWVEVNGWRATANYGQGSTSSSIASSLRSILNEASSPVTAGGSGATITLTSKATGASSNYTLTVGRTYDTSNFSSPSFTASRSGATLTGGADAQYTTVYDSGTVWVEVNGWRATANYGQGSTSSTIASSLRSILNGGSSPVTAGGTGTTITLTSKASGASTNYTLTVGQTYDTSEFSSPSFTASRSGATLTGGQDAQYQTIYDSGTVWVEVNGFRATANYGQGSTSSSIASSLRSILNGGPSPVTAGGTGTTITLTSKATGASSNYTLTVGRTYDTSNFSSPSFTASRSGSTLTGGADAVPPGELLTSYTYDVLGRLTQVAQGAQTRSYAYDGLGRLTSVATSETNNVAASFTYNSFSQVLTRTDPRGVIKTFAYDGLNRLTQVSYSDSTPTVSFTYGTSAASNNNGRLITVTYNGSSNTESFTYDGLGRVTQATKKIDNLNYPVSYAYNLASELTSLTYPSGRVVQQTYDGIGRLSQVASGGSPYASGFAYNTAQQVTGFTYGNQVVASFGYSAQRLQLTSLSYIKGAETRFSLSYDYTHPNGGNNGQITRITDNTGTDEAGRTVDYTYDELGRLKTAVTVGSAAYPQWGLSWSYDRYGNRNQTVTVPDGTVGGTSLSFSVTTNRITSSGFSYDESGSTARGNLTNDALNTYTYDAENRVKTVNGTGATYSYDGASLRVKKVAGGTTTRYIYSGTKVIAEYANGSLSKEYIYSGSQLLVTLDSGVTPTYHHSDHLSARVSTDSSGEILKDAQGNKIGEQGHYPFGEVWYKGSAGTKWQFTSYEHDAESTLDYAIFRSDNSRLGRFMQPDPLAGSIFNPQSLNRYSYVRNNPINLIDPLGLCGQLPTVPFKTNVEDSDLRPGVGGKPKFGEDRVKDGEIVPHEGLDIGAKLGQTLYPLLPGTVVAMGYDRISSGHWVAVDAGGGVVYSYSHLLGPAPVRLGDTVGLTTAIGFAGRSGNARNLSLSELHTHLKVTINGDVEDPLNFINEMPCPTGAGELTLHDFTLFGMLDYRTAKSLLRDIFGYPRPDYGFGSSSWWFQYWSNLYLGPPNPPRGIM